MHEDFQRAGDDLRMLRGQLSVGHLVTPAYTCATTESDGRARWGFRTPVLPEVLRSFRLNTRTCAVTSEGLQVERDDCFWVIGYQAGGLLQRFVLPLVGPTVAQLLDSVTGEGLLLMLDGEEGEPAFRAVIDVPQDQAVAFRMSHRPLERTHGVVEGILAAASLLRDPYALRPADGMAQAGRVCLAVILPPELVERAPTL